MPVLKLPADDPEKELAFELRYQAGLTVEQRFDMMLRKSREISELLEKHGHKKPFEIIKRA
jgi:hypothetical protein